MEIYTVEEWYELQALGNNVRRTESYQKRLQMQKVKEFGGKNEEYFKWWNSVANNQPKRNSDPRANTQEGYSRIREINNAKTQRIRERRSQGVDTGDIGDLAPAPAPAPTRRPFEVNEEIQQSDPVIPEGATTGEKLARKEDEQKASSIQNTVAKNIEEVSQASTSSDSNAGVVNKDYRTVASTGDALIETGKVNLDAVVSAFKVTSGLPAGSPVPHYFQMDKNPVDPKLKKYKRIRVGGTIFRGPGTFSLRHGDSAEGSRQTSAGTDGKGEPGVYIDAINGDLVLTSKRRVRIIAENIDLIATGDDGINGNITLDANENIDLINAKKINIEAENEVKIFSDDTVQVMGKHVLNMYGTMLECADGLTYKLGSVGGPSNPYKKQTQWEIDMKKMIDDKSLPSII